MYLSRTVCLLRLMVPRRVLPVWSGPRPSSIPWCSHWKMHLNSHQSLVRIIIIIIIFFIIIIVMVVGAPESLARLVGSTPVLHALVLPLEDAPDQASVPS
jgi:hypothetical protein